MPRHATPTIAAHEIDGRAGAAPALHLHRDGDADPARHAVRAGEDGDGHLSGDQHPGDLGDLELQRPAGAGDGAEDRRLERARPDHHGERHRAHRVDLARQLHGDQDLLPAHRQHPDRDRSSGGGDAAAGAPAAAGHHAAADHQVLGLQHPGDPARALQPDAAGADGVRLGGEPAQAAARHDPRRGDPVPLRRQDPRDLGGSRHAGAAGARPVAGRRGQRGQHAEPDPALGHRQARRDRIHGAHERLAGCDPGAERAAGAHPGRRHDLHPRRGAGARRLLAADQHRAARWRARRADFDPQEQRCLDPRHRRQPARDAAARRPDPAERHQGGDALRPVAVRRGGDQGRGARGADRGAAHRVAGAPVPRQLEEFWCFTRSARR